jgi:hypothetical protein
MKWYFAINEAGTTTPLAQHAKLAVRTARRMTNLQPHLLYFGARNDFTTWMESQGVSVIDTQPSFLADIYRAADDGWYSRALTGHWLRTEVCNIEPDEQFVLYTDIDVVFFARLSMSSLTPKYFACAPEFKPDDWSYFNSGIMLMNIPALRADYPNLRRYIREKLANPQSGIFNDQHVYNEFYRNHWSRLDPIYNWKPYWAPNHGMAILHLHGPKFHDICQIIEGRWNWQTLFGRQVGDIFVTHLPSYLHHLESLLTIIEPDDELYSVVEHILRDGPSAVKQILIEREGQHDRAELASAPTARSEKVLTTLECPKCGLVARIIDTFQDESHNSNDFRGTLHAQDLAAFNEHCREQPPGHDGCGGVAPFCDHLHQQLRIRMCTGSKEAQQVL